MLAIVIIGQMRSYKNIEIINSYKKYLSNNESIDLYIFTWDKLGYSNRHGNANIHSKCNDIVINVDILEYYKKRGSEAVTSTPLIMVTILKKG